MKLQKTLIGLVIAGTLTGCATTPVNLTANQRLAAGATLGAIAGAVAGHQVHDKNGRYVGAALGALAGGAIANYMNQQQQVLQSSPELKNKGINVSRQDTATIKLNLPSAVTFAVDKADLNSNVINSLNEIVGVLNQYPSTVIHVSGFTDSDGSDAYNLALSQRRAQAVANYLISRGVAASRLRAKGYGESHPIASNASAAGKAQNRRAELHIRAIEQGKEQAAYMPIY